MEHNINYTPPALAPHIDQDQDLEAANGKSPLELSSISIDGGTQARHHLHDDVIDDYAAAISNGATFPPIIVFYDGAKYWLADGFHRYHAAAKAGRTEIDADVKHGTRRDAILHSVGANGEHGLRRTNEDKRRAVLTLLGDAEWSQWPDAEVARIARVGRNLINRLRNSHLPSGASEPAPRMFVNKHGFVSTMNVARIGKASSQMHRGADPEFVDSDFEAEADAAARDLEIERDERIALSGGTELAIENEKLNRQVAMLCNRIEALVKENSSLKYRDKRWRERAKAAGWKGRDDA